MKGALLIALRRARRRPVLPMAVVILAAVAVSLNGALFSVIDAVYLRASPFESPDELFVVGPRSTLRDSATPDPVSQTMADDIGSLAGIRQVETAGSATLDASSGTEDTAGLRGARVTLNFFDMLGVEPVAGRLFVSADLGETAARPVLISRGLWRDRFGGVRSVVGDVTRIGGVNYRVVGVLPDRVRIPFGANIWVLSDGKRLTSDAYFRSLVAVVRGAPSALRNLGPTARYQAQPITEYLEPRGGLALTLIAAVGLLVLLAMWSQLASLQATKIVERENEVLTRLALGATAGAIRLLFLVEALVLTTATLILALWLVPSAQLFLKSTLPASLVDSHDLPLDGRVFLVVALLAVSSVIVQGIALFRVGRPSTDGVLALRQHGGSSTARMSGLRGGLLVVQFGAATGLLYLAGLAAHSGATLLKVDSGFDTVRVLAVPIAWDRDQQVMADRYLRLADAVAALSGAASVAGASTRPLGGARFTAPMSMGQTRDSELAELTVVTPGYFETLGIRLIAGRDFSPDDKRDRPRVAIVNQRAATLLGGVNQVIGRTLPISGGMPRLVVGVVADARMAGPDQPPSLQLYEPATQSLQPAFLFAKARSPEALHRLQLEIGALMRRQEPDRPVRTVVSLAALQDQMTAPQRGRLALLFAIASSAIAVTSIGLFGAVEDLVSRQQRIIAIRLVLGASRRDIVSSVIRNVAALSLGGGGIGLAVGVAAGRAAQSLLFGVSPADGLAAGVSVGVLVSVIALAVALPLRRALRVEPAAALRDW